MYITKRTVQLFDEVSEEQKDAYVITIHAHKGEPILLKVVDAESNEVLQKERLVTT